MMKSAFAEHDKLALLIIGVVLLLALYAFGPLLGVVILAVSLAVVVMPLKSWLTRYMNEGVAALLVTIIVGAIVIGALAFGIGILYENADYLTQIITDIYNALVTLAIIPPSLTPNAATGPLIDVGEILNTQMETVQTGFFSVVSGFMSVIFNSIIFFLALYIFVLFGDGIWRNLLSGVPKSLESFVNHIEEISSNTLYSIYIVHISTSVITFLLAIPFFYVLGYGHIVFWSLIVALFQLIPIIGPTLIMIFLGIFALATGDYRAAALIAIIGYPVVCAVPDLLFRPIMMGKRTSIHPAIMWIGFFGGLWLMGIVGFVIGPLVLALLVASGRELIRIMRQAKENGWLEKPPV